MAKELPKDYALLALTAEAERRRKVLGIPGYNYGRLVADTTPEERQKIVEDYEKNRGRRKPAEVFTDPEDQPCVPLALIQEREPEE